MTATLSDLASLVDRQWHAHGRETPLDGLVLTRADRPSGVIRSVYRPSFCVVVQGAKTTMLGETPFRYAAGEGLLASVDLPVTARITRASADAPYLALSLAIDPESVADLLSAHGDALAKAPPFTPLSVAAFDPALCDPLARLLALLDAPHDLAVLAPLIRKEIAWRLLQGSLGGSAAAPWSCGRTRRPHPPRHGPHPRPLCRTLARRRSGGAGAYERAELPSALQGGDDDDAGAVP